jgi:hypothetical protein
MMHIRALGQPWTCDFRVAHDNGGRDAVVAADDDDDSDVGAAFAQTYVVDDDE